MTLLQTDLLGNKSQTFQALRYLMQTASSLQPGVEDVNDFKVVQRAAGASSSVDVGAGAAWVLGQSNARQGLYHQVNDATITQGTFANMDPTNPRVDQLLLTVNDSAVSGASDTPGLVIVTGTPASGAQANNFAGANYRAGAVADATLTSTYHNWIRLADVVVPSGSGAPSITNAMIIDRRAWAKGAFRSREVTAGNYTTTSTTLGAIDATNLTDRIECSGAPVRVHLRGRTFNTGGLAAYFGVFMDGAALNGMDGAYATFPSASESPLDFVWDIFPTAGSHLIQAAWRVAGGTQTLYAQSSPRLQWCIEEIVKGNANNGTS